MKILLIVILILGFVFTSKAQPTDAKITLRGIVYDENGAVIVGAVVAVQDKKGKLFQSVSSNDGNYQFEIPPGIYTLLVNASGFKIFQFVDYRVVQSYDSKMNFDVVLEVIPPSCEPAGCLYDNAQPIPTEKVELPSNKIFYKTSEESPKIQNKPKRKKINNKQ